MGKELNTQKELSKKDKIFKIFKNRWVDKFDLILIVFKLSIVPMGIIAFFFNHGANHINEIGNTIYEAYFNPIEIIYTIFNLIFNQSTILEFDSAKDILPCAFTVVTVGLFTYSFGIAFNLFFTLIFDGVERVWEREGIYYK